jgi:hypothetical protein
LQTKLPQAICGHNKQAGGARPLDARILYTNRARRCAGE